MKKLIIMLAAVLLFAACSKKQNPVITLTPQNATVKDLTGTWTITTDTAFTTTNGQTTTQAATNTNNTQFVFNADGTGGENANNTVVQTFTYTIAAGIITMHLAANGNTQASDLILTIEVITASKLILRDGDGGPLYIDLAFIKS